MNTCKQHPTINVEISYCSNFIIANGKECKTRLQIQAGKNPQKQVRLNGKYYNVARLVLETYKKKPCNNKCYRVAFIDGDSTNTDLNNLEWSLKRNNSIKGQLKSAFSRSKLTKEQSKECFTLYNEGKTLKEIRKIYNLPYATIKRAVNRYAKYEQLK